MLLLPIGKEETEVRRYPWVSYAVIGLNLLVFSCTHFADDGSRETRLGAKVQEIGAYVSRHPYLVLPERLARHLCDAECQQDLARAKRFYVAADRVPSPAVVGSEQARLQELSDGLFALLEQDALQRWGYKPSRGGSATWVSSMFLHAGLLHIFGNMLFFFLSGPFVEDVFGRPLFAGLYLVAGFAATAAHAASNPASDVPLIGASGAIAGVMGAFLVRFAREKIRFLCLPVPLVFTWRYVFSLPAFVVLPLWFAEQVWYAHRHPDAGVAWWAHIGGFTLGFGAALAVKLSRLEERAIHPAIQAKISFTQDPALERAMDARLAGDWETARREIRGLIQRQPSSLDALAEGYEIAVASSDSGEAARLATRLLDLYVKQGETELAVGLAQDAPQRVGAALPVRFHLGAAGAMERAGRTDLALDLYDRLLELHPADPAALRALFRRGEICRRIGDRAAARQAFLKAREHPACDDAMRWAIDRALQDLEGVRQRP